MYSYSLTLKKTTQVFILGFECCAMTQEPSVQKQMQIAFEHRLALVLSNPKSVNSAQKRVNFTFGVNRDALDTCWNSFVLSLIQVVAIRITLVENEGGYSTAISGRLLVEVESVDHQTLSRKKLCFKVQSKGVDVFEKVEQV
jgi:hypothetical protein